MGFGKSYCFVVIVLVFEAMMVANAEYLRFDDYMKQDQSVD